jgi:hypothetical protein
LAQDGHKNRFLLNLPSGEEKSNEPIFKGKRNLYVVPDDGKLYSDYEDKNIERTNKQTA